MALAKIATLSKAKLARTVDELGALKAQITSLQEAYDQKIGAIKDLGNGEYLGTVYKVTVNTSERTSLDTKLVKGFLTPAQLAQASTTKETITALVKAR